MIFVKGISKLPAILIILLLTLVPSLGTQKTLDPNILIQFFALSVVMVVFYTILWLRKSKLIIRNKTVLFFIIAYLVFITYSIFSVYISSNKPDAWFSFAKYMLGFSIVIVFIFSNISADSFKIVAISITILSLIVSIPALYQLMRLVSRVDFITVVDTYGIRSILGHRNMLSHILMFTLPFTSYLYLTKKKVLKYLSVTVFNISLFLMIVLSNRTTWIGIVCLAFLWLLFMFIYKKDNFIQKITKLVFIGNVMAILIISIVFLKIYSHSNSIESHVVESLDVTKGSTKDRLGLWSRTLKLISEDPVIGKGLDTWKINMLKYGNEGLVSANNISFYQRPHNDFLWIAAEQGIVGVILYMFLFGIILISLIKSIKQSTNSKSKLQLLVILSVTIVFLIVSMLSFPKERIGHNILLFSSWGVFLGFLNQKGKYNDTKEISLKFLPFMVLPILLGVFVLGFARLNSDMHTKKAIVLKNSSKFKESLREIEKAKSFFYTLDATSTPLDWYAGMAYFKLKQYDKAAHSYKNALIVNPYNIYVLDDYASSLVKLNKWDEALMYYKKALNISSNFLNPKLNMCVIYFNNHDYIEALNMLKTIDVNDISPRYIKINRIILTRIIEEYAKFTDEEVQLLKAYINTNSKFFKQLITYTIELNLNVEQIANQALLIIKQTE